MIVPEEVLPATEKLSFTIKEAARTTGISSSALYEDAASCKLMMKKRGARTLILREELLRYLRALPDAPKFQITHEGRKDHEV